jgi:hypothetical protein
MKSESVDLVIYNAKIHLMDGKGTIVQAMAIRDGKIIEYGPDRQILNKYSYAESVDAQNKDVYPGLVDAHVHLFSYAEQKLSVGLVGCRSFKEVIQRIHKYQKREKRKIIVGRGWDQSLWGSNELPDNSLLNIEFPKTPVCIYRIDGHSALVNQAFIDLISPFNPAMKGGKVLYTDGKPNGLFIDAALTIIEPFIPKYSENKIRKELLGIQQELFQYGVTGVHEAGIDFNELQILKEMVSSNEMKLNIYAMLNPSKRNRKFATENGPYKNKNLSVRSFKAYVDGALGSRGALLKKPYEDMPEYNGLCLMNSDELKELGAFCLNNGYQLNSHGIGDSAISIILDMCKDIFAKNPDHRFRVEHAQIVDPKDFKKFSDYAVFSSVQPTHATTDQRWVESKIGSQRMKGAYAYKTLKESTGMIALGTDFPVEYTNPFYTIHAAVHRKNHKGEPKEGFLKDEALTMEETLQGMTIWAAYSAFEEKSSGSIEVGKKATFFILDKPLNLSSEFMDNFSWMTFIDGKLVYSIK